MTEVAKIENDNFKALSHSELMDVEGGNSVPAATNDGGGSGGIAKVVGPAVVTGTLGAVGAHQGANVGAKVGGVTFGPVGAAVGAVAGGVLGAVVSWLIWG